MSLEQRASIHEIMRVLGPQGLQDHEKILDLGCGDGSLLSMITAKGHVGIPCGVDKNDAAVRQAYKSMSNGFWVNADIRDIDLWPLGPFKIVLFMPGHLDEWSSMEQAEVMQAMTRRAQNVILYCYGDWVEKGGLMAIMSRYPTLLGHLIVLTELVTEPGVEAMRVSLH